MIPHDFPPWHAVYEQTQRRIAAGVCAAMAHDLRAILRVAQGRAAQSTAAIFDCRIVQSSPESGTRAGYDGATRRKGSTVHLTVDTLGHLLALQAPPANAQDRPQVGHLAKQAPAVTGESVETAFADAGYTGAEPAQAAEAEGIALAVVKLHDKIQIMGQAGLRPDGQGHTAAYHIGHAHRLQRGDDLGQQICFVTHRAPPPARRRVHATPGR